ncbi:MAG: aminoacyl-tRNA hydrolase [Clostridia bacterium]|nr:aminoacyl-tRNA hydrolase [Clostridia bacterium]
MYLIAGLGNPGREYEKTRHNVGFTALDYLAYDANITVSKIKFKGIYGDGMIAGEKCILLKPQTYMNLSGESVREAAEYFKIEPNKIIIVYDDVDLEPGKVRIRPKGSAGGHNGMKSIIYQLQCDEFPRVRFGVGKAEHGMVNHVLGRFSEEDGVKVSDAIRDLPKIIEAIIKNGVNDAMNKFNGK